MNPFRRQEPVNNYSARVIATRKANRRRRRQNTLTNVLAGLIVGAVAVALLVGLVLLFGVIGAILIYFGWNVGVVGISHAVHGHVGHISLLTAFGVSLAISALSRIFRRDGITVEKR